MDIDTLRIFLAITETGSFTGAGARVGRTQSAISQQIKKLEAQVGVPLLVRTSSGTALTADGARLVPLAQEVVDAQDRAIAAFSSGTRGGRVALGVPELLAEKMLPVLLPEFQRRYPSVEVSIQQDETAGLLRTLQSGRLDLTLFTDAAGEPGNGAELFRSQAVWVCAKGLALEEMRPMPIVVWRDGSHHRRVMLGLLDKTGIPYRIALTTQSISGILTAVSAGIGLGMVLKTNVTEDMRIIPPEVGLLSPPPPAVYLAERESVDRNPAAQAMAAHIRETLPKLS